MTLIVVVTIGEIDFILSGRLLPSCILVLVISFKGEGLLKVVTKLSLEVLIIFMYLVFKIVVSVLMIELIR